MSLTTQPFADSPVVAALSRDLHMNVSDPERAVSALAGAALVATAIRRHSPLKWLILLAGAAFLRRALTGECPWYAHRGIDGRHTTSRIRKMVEPSGKK